MTIIENIFSKIICSGAFYAKVKSLIVQAQLTNVESNIYKLITVFFEKYERMPTREELLLSFDNLPESERKYLHEYKDYINKTYQTVVEVANVDEQVLLDSLCEVIEKRGIKNKLVAIANDFDKKNTIGILDDIKDLLISNLSISNKSVYIDVHNVKQNIELVKYRATEKIPTMLPGLDKVLYGGIGVREITCIIAPSGKGKTAWLVNMMHSFLMQGYNVLFITLEMSVQDITRRLYRRILCENKDFLTDEKQESIIHWVNKFFALSKSRGKILYHPANSMSVEDIKTELTMLELADKFRPDVLVIDHLDLMVSHKKNIRQKEGFAYWRLLVDDLREMPLLKHIPVITATQSNRQSSRKTLVTEMDVGESFGKVQSSDVVLSLNQTPEEAENRRMRICVLKNRDYYKGMELEIYVDLDTMTMCDLYYAQINGWLK